MQIFQSFAKDGGQSAQSASIGVRAKPINNFAAFLAVPSRPGDGSAQENDSDYRKDAIELLDEGSGSSGLGDPARAAQEESTELTTRRSMREELLAPEITFNPRADRQTSEHDFGEAQPEDHHIRASKEDERETIVSASDIAKKGSALSPVPPQVATGFSDILAGRSPTEMRQAPTLSLSALAPYHSQPAHCASHSSGSALGTQSVDHVGFGRLLYQGNGPSAEGIPAKGEEAALSRARSQLVNRSAGPENSGTPTQTRDSSSLMAQGENAGAAKLDFVAEKSTEHRKADDLETASLPRTAITQDIRSATVGWPAALDEATSAVTDFRGLVKDNSLSEKAGIWQGLPPSLGTEAVDARSMPAPGDPISGSGATSGIGQTTAALHPPASALGPGAQMTGGQALAVSQQMATALASREANRVELVLSPIELGRVRMSMQSHDGALALVIHVERPETADLMRRHAETLSAELRQMGFSDLSLDISTGGDDSGHRMERGPGGEGAKDVPSHLPNSEPQSAPVRGPSGGVDLTV